jgi:hypothetical protein
MRFQKNRKKVAANLKKMPLWIEYIVRCKGSSVQYISHFN